MRFSTLLYCFTNYAVFVCGLNGSDFIVYITLGILNKYVIIKQENFPLLSLFHTHHTHNENVSHIFIPFMEKKQYVI